MRDYSENVNEAILGNVVILGTRLSWEWSSAGQSMKLSKAQRAYSQGSWNPTIFEWYTVLVNCFQVATVLTLGRRNSHRDS